MQPDKSYSPIFITGIERSGSSLVAQIVNLCGAYTGAGAVSDMYENIQIKILLNSYYKLLGVDIKGQYPLPNVEKLVLSNSWREWVERIMGEKKPWMLKGSRLGQLWPIWHYAFPTAKWIIVRRRPNDIIESCLKTGYMTAYKDREGWLKWMHLHEKLFVGMIEAGVNCKQVWPERMVNGDYRQIIEMIEWLGLTWDPEVIKIIDPLLWNSKQREKKGV